MARPTLLIGYGSHGHLILKDLLKSSSMRGLLKWNETDEIGKTRSLENLRIFYINDAGQDNFQDQQRDSPIYTDLFSQINEIKYNNYAARSRKDAIGRISMVARELRGIHQNQGVDALDIFFIAKPEDIPGELASLDGFMRMLIEQLNHDMPHVINQAQNAETLNFIEILDYNSLSNSQDLQRSLKSWEHARLNKGFSNAYGRIYICEESTAHGLRSYRLRQKETILFLEFLLFENNQQQSEFSRLYKAVDNEPILSAFGIRLGERNIEQLSRSVAIDFSRGWLDYIISQHNSESDPTVVSVLERLDIQGLLSQIEWDSIEKNILDNTNNVVNAIATQNSLSAVENIDTLVEKIKQIETEAAHEVSSKLSNFREQQLQQIKDELYQKISHDLCDAERRVTLSDLKQRIQSQIDKITIHQLSPENGEQFDEIESQIRKYYAQYEQFKNQCIDPQKSCYVYWLFAPLLAIAFTPSIFSLIQQLDPAQFPNLSFPDKLPFIYNHYLLSKKTSFLLSFLLIGLPFIWFSARFIKSTRDDSTHWFIHKDRGRLIHALRLAERKKILSSRFLQEIQHSLVTETQQILIDIKALLDDRHKEIAWLIAKLQDYRTLLKGTGSSDSFYHYLQKTNDKEAIKKYLPPTIARYKGQIPEAPQIFANWDAEYNNICLNPLEFIDHLSKNCKDAYYHNNDEEQEIFIEFLETIVQNFSVGVNFPQQQGLPADDSRYALISDNLRHPVISERLHQDLRMNESNIVYSDAMRNKIYLLIVKQGISATVLTKGAS